jgi:hypothetical protein
LSSTFAVPALPPHVAADKKPKLVPKSPFPDAYIAFLCARVAELRTGSLPVLVDAVYQDLRAHKVKKNAIEAKIREICAKDAGRWAVRVEVALGGGGAVSRLLGLSGAERVLTSPLWQPAIKMEA